MMPQTSRQWRPLQAVLGSIVALIVLAGCASQNAPEQPTEAPSPTPGVPTATPAPTPTDQPTTPPFMTFRSKNEGFTLEIPSDWTIEDTSDTNCGHAREINGSHCWERFDFVSPDGVRVRYAEFNDDNWDRIACGSQAVCSPMVIETLETIDVEGLGQVYMVKEQGGGVSLHLPQSAETVPVLGPNDHDNFLISFSVPSKTGGRYALFIPTSVVGTPPPPPLAELSSEQFFALPSVQQAVAILKSLNYTAAETP